VVGRNVVGDGVDDSCYVGGGWSTKRERERAGWEKILELREFSTKIRVIYDLNFK
jgi:hypothetical protein